MQTHCGEELKINMQKGVRIYSCEICKSEFISNSDFRMDGWEHIEEKQYVCEVCGFAFSQSSALKNSWPIVHDVIV